MAVQHHENSWETNHSLPKPKCQHNRRQRGSGRAERGGRPPELSFTCRAKERKRERARDGERQARVCLLSLSLSLVFGIHRHFAVNSRERYSDALRWRERERGATHPSWLLGNGHRMRAKFWRIAIREKAVAIHSPSSQPLPLDRRKMLKKGHPIKGNQFQPSGPARRPPRCRWIKLVSY